MVCMQLYRATIYRVLIVAYMYTYTELHCTIDISYFDGYAKKFIQIVILRLFLIGHTYY